MISDLVIEDYFLLELYSVLFNLLIVCFELTNDTYFWEQRKMFEIATFTKGKGYSKNDLSMSGFPIILYGHMYISYKTVINNVQYFVKDKLDGSVVSMGSEVIIPSSGETPEDIARASAVRQQGVIIGGDINILHPNTNVIDSPFLAYQLSSGNIKKQLSRRAQGKSIVHLYNSDIKNMPLIFPSINEQINIHKILELIEKTITLYQQQLGMLDKLKQSLLQQLFPKENSKTPKVRFSGFTEEWEQVQLSSVVSFINGKAFKQSELLNNGKYKVVRVGNFNTNGQWYYSNLELPKDKYISKGDLVYLWATNFGPEIWNGGKAIFHYHIWKLIFNEKSIDKGYLFYWLYMDKSKVLADTNGTTMIHITKGNMEERILDKPTKFLEQKKVGLMLTKVDSLIDLYQLKIERNKKTKNMLLQNLFV